MLKFAAVGERRLNFLRRDRVCYVTHFFVSWRHLVPELSRFLGILIFMYYDDHPPPHFHAKYGKHEVQVDISSMKVIAGSLPRPQLAFVVAWGLLNQGALFKAWEAVTKGKHPGKIPPLTGKKGGGKKKGKK